jgi:hypothetical protein
LPRRRRGARRKQLNGPTTFIGKNSVVMTSGVMTKLQYKVLLDTYEGLITIRLALDGITYANYNASLVMTDEADLSEYSPDIAFIGYQGSAGPGYKNVDWTVTDLDAI